MADNIIRFPGYLRTEDRTGVWKDGELHKSFKKMVRGLSEQDRERTYHWTLKRQGRASYYAAVLENDAIGGAA